MNKKYNSFNFTPEFRIFNPNRLAAGRACRYIMAEAEPQPTSGSSRGSAPACYPGRLRLLLHSGKKQAPPETGSIIHELPSFKIARIAYL